MRARAARSSRVTVAELQAKYGSTPNRSLFFGVNELLHFPVSFGINWTALACPPEPARVVSESFRSRPAPPMGGGSSVKVHRLAKANREDCALPAKIKVRTNSMKVRHARMKVG